MIFRLDGRLRPLKYLRRDFTGLKTLTVCPPLVTAKTYRHEKIGFPIVLIFSN
jgi:hypothetical protein